MPSFTTNALAPETRWPDRFVPTSGDVATSTSRKPNLAILFIADHADKIINFFVIHDYPETAKPYQQSTTPIMFHNVSLERANEIQNTSIREDYFERFINDIYSSIDVVQPDWCEELEKALRELTALPEDWSGEPTAKFSTDMADLSNLFFAKYSGLLPSKPIIYPTRKGDLAAEIKIDGNSITLIVTKKDLIVFASKPDDTRCAVVHKWQTEPHHVVAEIENALAFVQVS